MQCLQCGSCGGSCPSAADMDYTPRALFALINAGDEEEVLDSNTPWFCVSCYTCMVRCPQQIPITDIMYTLKQMAIRRVTTITRMRPNFPKPLSGLSSSADAVLKSAWRRVISCSTTQHQILQNGIDGRQYVAPQPSGAASQIDPRDGSTCRPCWRKPKHWLRGGGE